MSHGEATDSVLRAMTDDGAFRVVVARTTQTVAGTLRAQAVSGASAARLGELVTGAILVRETMAPEHRLQGIVRNREDDARLVADSYPDGGTRGLIARADQSRELSLDGGTLEIVRTLYSGDLHRGVVEVPEGGGMSEALMSYLQSSEQVASMLEVACVLHDDQVAAAGGYLVQLLPEVGRGALMVMTERLQELRDLRDVLATTDAAPAPLLAELLYAMPYTQLSDKPLSWKCRCSEVRVMSSLAALSRAELTELVEGGRTIELSCDFCRHGYAVNPAQLTGLLEQS